jgi:DNA-binding NtrC family response regulator
MTAHRKTLLVVDDEVEIAKALRRLLRKEFDVELAHTGDEALLVLEKSPIDLVLSDFRMPGMNGAELLAEVERRKPGTARVMLSGYADIEASGAPAHDPLIPFLRKPWDDAVLLATLRKLTAGDAP